MNHPMSLHMSVMMIVESCSLRDSGYLKVEKSAKLAELKNGDFP